MGDRTQSLVISAVICTVVGNGIVLAVFMAFTWRGHPLWVPILAWTVYYFPTAVFIAPVGILAGLVGGSFLHWRAKLLRSVGRLYLEAAALGAVLGFVLSGWIWWLLGVLSSVAGAICGALLVSFLSQEKLLQSRAVGANDQRM